MLSPNLWEESLVQQKADGVTHYGRRSRFTPRAMCGLSAAHVRFTSDDRRVTCPDCLRTTGEGAALFPGGGRNMRAE